jgi:hypothetical protein
VTVPTQGHDSSGITVERLILSTVEAIREDIKRFVTKEAADAETRRLNAELAHQAQDIADERTERKESEARTAQSIRWLWSAVIIPVAGLVVTVYLATKG